MEVEQNTCVLHYWQMNKSVSAYPKGVCSCQSLTQAVWQVVADTNWKSAAIWGVTMDDPYQLPGLGWTNDR